MRLNHFALTCVLTLAACTPAPESYPPVSSSSSSVAVSTAEATAQAALTALKTKDGAALAKIAHPTKGIRFTVNTHVNTGDVVLTPTQLQSAFTDPTVHTWGYEEGSGMEIEETFSDYYDRYVFDHDFTMAPTVVWDTPGNRGSIVENISSAYPGARFVEYHFPGFDAQYEGMDWSSLSLVLLQESGTWYVVGVVHGEWAP